MRYLLAATSALALLATTTASALDWTVDPSQSQIAFSVSVNQQPVIGRFDAWTSLITFDPANLAAAHARVVIDLNTAVTGDETRDKALKSQQWFDTGGKDHVAGDSGFQEAVFETSSFRSTGTNTFEATGSLSMRGVTVPITLPFTLDISARSARMNATVSLNRTLWGVGQGDFSDEKPVGTNVEVTISISAKSD